GGGLNLGPTTYVEIGLTLGAGVALIAAALLVPSGRPVRGLWAVGGLLAFTGLTALSVAWSIRPDASLVDTGRMLAYAALFGACVALVRAAPSRWPALIGAVTLGAVVVCGYALLTKVFPAQLDHNDIYSRLRAPYDYWNAIGLTAAMGLIGSLWLGARREGHALWRALAYPATGLLLVTLLLAYSRGALLAAGVGIALWMCVVPLRLRGATLLIVAGACAGVVVAFDFATHALSANEVSIAARVHAGRQLGVLLVAMLGVLAVAGVAVQFLTGRRAPGPALRRRAGTLLIAGLIGAVVAAAGALTLTHRGLTGTISHDVSSLTNPNAPVPANTPSRLTAIGSVRARYWKEALQIFSAHPVLGAGAATYETARLRYRKETLDVRHAHGFIVQTLSDLGAIGLALVLALLAVWLAAAGRATHPFNRRWQGWRWRAAPQPYTAERVGMLSLLCLVVVFGVHSLVDWTWYVPGNACVALACAGWLAGRGELDGAERGEEEGAQEGADARARQTLTLRLPELGDLSRVQLVAAAAIAALVGLSAWVQWQPQRSAEASAQALSTLERHPTAALAQAQAGVAHDPLSVEALLVLSTVQRATGEAARARQTLERAVRLQPSNPASWQALGEYNLAVDPQAALRELRAALYLNPKSVPVQNAYIQALRATGAAQEPATATATGAAGASRTSKALF
ncbi:MAG: O-antigen ligase family protein, partial [Solirubrobacterales bacterium]|nr:O-antigen ligase family protein [Solirubrobacterales bacterium]